MPPKTRLIAAGIVGNIVEYYDFALIGFLAVTIGKLFFPADDPLLSLLSAFGAFAAGMVMRPVGALIFGHVGDRIGRRYALLASLGLMAAPTFLIGCLPTYETAGAAAPLLLVLLRMVQGLSVGGEYASSIVYLVEQASTGRRNLYGSFVSVGAKAGMALGSGFYGVLLGALGDEAMAEWGWRIPFLASLVIAGIGMGLRHGLLEDYVPPRDATIPIVAVIRDYRAIFFRYLALASMIWILYYTLFIYLSTWLEKSIGLPKETAVRINTVSIVAGAVLIPLSAWIADRIGGSRVMRFAAAALAVGAYPLMAWMASGSGAAALTGTLVLVMILCAFQAPIFAAVVGALPQHGYRASFAAVVLGSAAGIVGGVTPMMMTSLVAVTHDPLAAAYVLTAAGAVGFALLRRV